MLKPNFRKLCRLGLVGLLVFLQMAYGPAVYAAQYLLLGKHTFLNDTGLIRVEKGDVDGDGIQDLVAYKIRDGSPATILVKGEWSGSTLSELGEIIPSELTTKGNDGAIVTYLLDDIDKVGKDEVILTTFIDREVPVTKTGTGQYWDSNTGTWVTYTYTYTDYEHYTDGYVSVYSWDGTKFVRKWLSADLVSNLYNNEDYGGAILGLTTGDSDNDGNKEIAVTIAEPIPANIEKTDDNFDKELDNPLVDSCVKSRLVVFEYDKVKDTFYRMTLDKGTELGKGIAYRLHSGDVDGDGKTEFVANMVDLNYTNANEIWNHYKNYDWGTSSSVYYGDYYYSPKNAPGAPSAEKSTLKKVIAPLEKEISSALKLDSKTLEKFKNIFSKTKLVSMFLKSAKPQSAPAAPQQAPALSPEKCAPSYAPAQYYGEPSHGFRKDTSTLGTKTYSFKSDIKLLFTGKVTIIDNDLTTIKEKPLSEAFVLSQVISDINKDGKDDIIVKTFDFNYGTINDYFAKLTTNGSFREMLEHEVEYRGAWMFSPPGGVFEHLCGSELIGQYYTSLVNPLTGKNFDLNKATKTYESWERFPFPVNLPQLSGSLFVSKLVSLKSDFTDVWAAQEVGAWGGLEVKVLDTDGTKEILVGSSKTDITELNRIISHFDGFIKKMNEMKEYDDWDKVIVAMDKLIPNLSDTFITSDVKVYDASNGTLKSSIDNVGTILNAQAILGDSDNNGQPEIAVGVTALDWTAINGVINDANYWIKKECQWEIDHDKRIDQHIQQLIPQWNSWAGKFYIWYAGGQPGPEPIFNEDLNKNNQLDLGEDVNQNGILDPSEAGINGILDAGEDLNANGKIDHYNRWPNEWFNEWDEPEWAGPKPELTYVRNLIRIYERTTAGAYQKTYENDRAGTIILGLLATDVDKNTRPDLTFISTDIEIFTVQKTETYIRDGYNYYGNWVSYTETDTWYDITDAIPRGILGTIGSATASGAISGTVQDSLGSPVAGANVTLTSDLTSIGTKTDSSGNFTAYNLPPGSYKILVSAVGYEVATASATLSEGQTFALPSTIVLTSLKKLSGTVTSAGAGVVGALVVVENPRYRGLAMTDYAGYYAIYNLRTDTYTITATKLGYLKTVPTQLYIDHDTVKDFVLQQTIASISGTVSSTQTASVSLLLFNAGAVRSKENVLQVYEVFVTSVTPTKFTFANLEQGKAYDIVAAQLVNNVFTVLTSSINVVAPKTDLPLFVTPKIVVTVEEALALSKVYVTPSPLYKGDSTARIYYTLSKGADVEVEIYNSAAVLVSTGSASASAGGNSFNLPAPVYNTEGFYLFSLTASKGTETVYAGGTIKVFPPAKIISSLEIKPSPLISGQGAKIVYQSGADLNVDIAIKVSAAASPIWTVSTTTVKGMNIYEWNGKLTDGTFIPAGIYLVQIKVTTAGTYQGQVIETYLRVLRDIVLITNVYASPSYLVLSPGATTKICYTLSRKAEGLKVKIYDSNNNFVRDVSTTTQVQTGENSVTWDGKNAQGNYVSEGLYFFEITYGESIPAGGTIKVVEVEKVKILSTEIEPLIVKLPDDTKLTIYYILSKGAQVTTEIRDSADLPVETLELAAQKTAGLNSVSWTWTVAPTEGEYTYLITAVDADGYSVKRFGSFRIIRTINIVLKDVNVQPNSFSPVSGQTTLITYTLENAGEIKAEVYDKEGKVVKTFTNLANLVRVTNPVTWNGKDDTGKILDDGLYLLDIYSSKQHKVRFIRIITADTTPPVLTVKAHLVPGTQKLNIMVISNETLVNAPDVTVEGNIVTVSQEGNSNIYRGAYTSAFGEFAPDTDYTVIAAGTDLAGNTGIGTANFRMKAITPTADTKVEETMPSGKKVTADIPANAVTDNQIYLNETPAPENIKQADLKIPGKAVDLSLPSETKRLAAEVTITLPYDANELSQAGVNDPTKLKLYRWDEELSKWVYVGGEVDITKKEVKAKVAHLSTFALAADVEAPDAPNLKPPLLVGPLAALVSGRAEPGSSVEISKNGISVGAVQADEETGEFSMNVSLGAGTNKIDTYASDPAGNTSKASSLPIAGPSLTLKEVKVYPNPYKPNSPPVQTDRVKHTKIVFAELSGSADNPVTIQVYDISGDLVWEKKEITNTLQNWDVQNTEGEPVASGIYIYLITDKAGNKTTGKLAIIR